MKISTTSGVLIIFLSAVSAAGLVNWHAQMPDIPAVWFGTSMPAVSSSTPAVVTRPTPATPVTPVVPAPATSTAVSTEIRFSAYITGYGWPDNTPPGSAAVSNPVIHQLAGGIGTYSDPITLAVGHSIIDGKDHLDYQKGTRFYIPNLRKYFVVEDTCGDGDTPQHGPCHTGYQGNPWLDLWVGGEGADTNAVHACQRAITGLFLVIQHPASHYKVAAGEVYSNGCARRFGNTVVAE